MDSRTEVSKKRKSQSPLVSREKERKGEQDTNERKQGTGNSEDRKVMDSSNVEQSAWDELGQVQDRMPGATSGTTSRRTSVTTGESFATVTSLNSQQKKKPTRESVFVTKKPEGAFRDELVVEFQTLDDKPFKGSITVKEARKRVYQEILGFQQEDLASLRLTYSGMPIAIFKLKSQFNIDNLEKFQNFDLVRPQLAQGEAKKDSVLKCKIRGIRTEQRVEGEAYKDTGMRWVKVEGSDFRVEKEKMIEWLSYFGEIKSEITEDELEGSDDSADDLPPCGNGIYSVKMRIVRDMPQFMPMYGKRVRLYYRGIVKRCSNCFMAHKRNQCKNERVTWPDYVKGFNQIFPDIPKGMYGKWGAFIQSN